MGNRDEFDRAFAEELSALEGFFDRRAEDHDHFKLGRQDPDVRRILEAVAFFSARTRLLAQANVREVVERMAREQLDFLLTPLPAAGLLEVAVNEGLGGPSTLPRGTEVRIAAPDRTVAIFTTSRRLDLLPLRLTSVSAPLGQARLALQLDAWMELRGELPALAFHVDVRGSYRESLRVLRALADHVRAARVVFDDDDPASAEPASFSVGLRPEPQEDDGASPIARVRSFFHFPAQDLFFTVALPARRRPWRRATLQLELGGDPPRDLLRLDRESLPLFVVPIANARRGDAQPILCDGTKDDYPIRDARSEAVNAGREAPWALCAVDGVYQVGDRGREPVPPGVIADAGAVYHLTVSRADERGEPEPRVALTIPGAFEKPRKVIVDARWYQPGFDASAAGRLEVSLPARRVAGARLEIAGDLALSRKSPLWDDPLGLLHVMSLRTRPVLTRDELARLVRLLGADRGSHYRRLPELLRGVHAEEAPGEGGRGTKYVYALEWRRDDPDFEGLARDGLVAAFEDQVAALLDAWISDDVELRRSGEPARAAPKPEVLRLVAGARR